MFFLPRRSGEGLAGITCRSQSMVIKGSLTDRLDGKLRSRVVYVSGDLHTVRTTPIINFIHCLNGDSELAAMVNHTYSMSVPSWKGLACPLATNQALHVIQHADVPGSTTMDTLHPSNSAVP